MADHRVDNWFLMNNPLWTALICILYVYLVKVAGPRWMKGRPAYQLRTVIIMYNIIQVITIPYLGQVNRINTLESIKISIKAYQNID